MRVIIAGSRTCPGYHHVKEAIRRSGFTPTLVISGGAIGVDRFAEQWALENNVPVRVFRPNYRFPNDRQAPIIRNRDMATFAGGLIAVWDASSKGTLNMIQVARRKGLYIYVHIYPGKEETS